MTVESILVFVPARNEAKTIASVISTAKAVICQTVPAAQVSVVVIDDGSEDETGSLAGAEGAIVFRHETSRGLGANFSQAVAYAIRTGVDVMVTIDGDGQFFAEDLPSLLGPVLTGSADFVTGSRFARGWDIPNMSGVKKMGNRLMSLLVSSILGRRYRDVSCGFRVYGREALLHLNLFGRFTYTQETFLNLGYKSLRLCEVPIRVQYFPERRSRIAGNIVRYAWQTLLIIVKSLLYYRPLRFLGALAVILIFPSLVSLAVLSVRYLETGLISPHKGVAITSLVGMAVGIGIFSLGVVCQIISRLQFTADAILYHERRRSEHYPIHR